MAAEEAVESETSQPGPERSVVIYDDRRQSKIRMWFEIVLVPLGILGMAMGRGDLAGGSMLLGTGQVAAAVIVAGYGLRASILDSRRLKSPIFLTIARDGFEFLPGRRRMPWLESVPPQKITWAEVATVSDPKAPEGDPRNLRIQLDDPAGFADRHELSLFARLLLRFNQGDLVLGGGMAKPVAEVERLMRKQLVEYRGLRSASSNAAPRRHEPRRRVARKR